MTSAALDIRATEAIGGVALEQLAQRVGSTPFFAYDRAQLTGRIAQLRAALPADLELSYAVKANPMPAIVQHLSGLVDAFDVASADEMRVALDTTMPATRVSFAGPGKTPAELTRAIAAGVTLELESPTEARRAAEIGAQLGIRPRAAVRVNPDFRIKGSGMRMGGGAQQFGVDAENVPALVDEIVATDIDWLGFHIFAGSQNLSAEVLCEAQRKTFELALALADAAPAPVRYLNIGGGFGIPYTDKDQPLDLGAVGDHLATQLRDVVRPRLGEARIVTELGRYIVGECGYYVTRVVDRKQSRGKTFLVVDGGMHHQLAASGNFGQVIRRNFPVSTTRTDAPIEVVSVVGCLCTPLDLLAADVMLPEIQIGDLVIVHQAGAYGLTASPAAFLSHPAAAEVLV